LLTFRGRTHAARSLARMRIRRLLATSCLASTPLSEA
jgi:hypothetical protein